MENSLKMAQSLMIVLYAISLNSAVFWFSERMNTQHEQLRDAIYNCKWYEQSKSFKKKILIMQLIMNRDIKLKTIKFTMDRKNLYGVSIAIGLMS